MKSIRQGTYSMAGMKLNKRAMNAELALDWLRKEARKQTDLDLEINVRYKPPKSILWEFQHAGATLVLFDTAKGKIISAYGRSSSGTCSPSAALETAIKAARLSRSGSESAEVEKEEAIEAAQDVGLSLDVSSLGSRFSGLRSVWKWEHPILGVIMTWWPNSGRWDSIHGSGEEIHTPTEALQMAMRLVQAVQNGMSRMAVRA